MAVIAQADPYQRLARKIGYSVGLEEVVSRVKMLVDLYVKDGSLSLGSFTELVEKGFKRKNAVHHFANFYGALNLVRYVGRAIEPLYQLDALSILRRMFEHDDRGFDTAVKVVLTQSIIEEDGDIFVNGLISDFRPDQMRHLLQAMVETKISHATKDMRAPHIMRKLSEALSIKNQSADAMSEHKEDPLQGRFARRTAPLSSQRRTSALTPPAEVGPVVIPDDYIEKASQTRKGWAQDLDLFRAGKKTLRGEQLLEQLSVEVISREPRSSAALFWGYKSELDRMQTQLQIDLADAKKPEAWDLLAAISRAFVGNAAVVGVPSTADEVVKFLQETHELYKAGNLSKAIIRNSLPLYIAEPVLAGWCTAQGYLLPNLPEILLDEYARPERKRVQKMIIRGTAGALFFMR